MKSPYDRPNSMASKARIRRFAKLRKLVDKTLAEEGRCRILDVGGTPQYWDLARDILDRDGVTVTVVNLEAPEATHPSMTTVTGDARQLESWEDGAFDLVHSNSVIEHVGKWPDMRAMATHVRRLAPRYFIQTPYVWFPIEPHYRAPIVHWLPEHLRVRLLMNMKLGFRGPWKNPVDAWDDVQSINLLDRLQMRTLFPDAAIVPERFGPLTKSLMAIRG